MTSGGSKDRLLILNDNAAKAQLDEQPVSTGKVWGFKALLLRFYCDFFDIMGR